jgi:exosome complex exonuclease DIS3/RRP44
VQEGIKAGRLYQGTLHTFRTNCNAGFVPKAHSEGDIVISGRMDMNRAMDGDVVVVELLPRAKWGDGAEKVLAEEHHVDNAQKEVEGESAPICEVFFF